MAHVPFSPPPVIVALDCPEPDQALRLARRLDPARCRLKVGKELFTSGGPAVVERLMEAGFELFLDLKFHDIPNTVAGACRAAARLGVWMINVHALGGKRMMAAAREALEGERHRPMLVAVTILTSMGERELREIGLIGTSRDNVMRLAALARESGMDGVVCSPREAAELRRRNGAGFCLVTPGVRPTWAAKGDQTRILTPAEARAAGADYLVVGRPVTQAPDPLQALARIEKEL